MSVAAGEKKKVLLLHSYHQGFFWTDEITRGVRDELKDTNTKLYIEYMDTKHHLEPGVLDLLEDLIAYKHKLYGYDLIISSDNNAYNFVMKIRQDTFADIPYVFCGVNNPPSLGKRDRHNISGIHERIDIMGNIQLIRNLHPKCERIIIPVDNTPTGEAILEEINSLGFGNSLYDGISIETVTGFTFDELIQRLRAATPPDVVLMTVLFRDWNNDFLEYDKQTLLVMENTDVPVYASWDFNIGYGVVGGRVVCGYDQGTAAARKALHFLQGTHADEIPMQFETPTRLMLDYNQLKRFGIDTNPLIAEADIVNKPVTFYDRYSVLIWQAGAIILLLMAALAGVLLSLLRVHRANARVKESEDSLRTTLDSIGDGVIATDLSGRIVRMNPVAEKLTGWKISDAVGKDLNDVFRISDIDTGMAAENPADKVLQENTITT
ncbi:MAG: ABC transporter substrate binding protein, partial [Spirochaetota bacterium]